MTAAEQIAGRDTEDIRRATEARLAAPGAQPGTPARRHIRVTECLRGGPVARPTRCTCQHCTLRVCKVCGAYEGGLTTHCPGERVDSDTTLAVYRTDLDYTTEQGWHSSGVSMGQRRAAFEPRSRSLTIGQLRELFRSSTDADVVRACLVAFGDSHFMLDGAPSDEACEAADAAVLRAWGARNAATSGVAFGRLSIADPSSERISSPLKTSDDDQTEPSGADAEADMLRGGIEKIIADFDGQDTYGFAARLRRLLNHVDTGLRVIEGGFTAKRLTDADLATVAEMLRLATDFETFGMAAGDLIEWQPRLREVRRKMVETLGDVTSPERATRRNTPDVPLEIEHEHALAAVKIILSGWRVISNADLECMAHVVRNHLEGRTAHNMGVARGSQGPGGADLGVTITGPQAQATVIARAIVEMLAEADIRASMPEEAVNPYDGDSIEQLGSLRGDLRNGSVLVQTSGARCMCSEDDGEGPALPHKTWCPKAGT